MRKHFKNNKERVDYITVTDVTLSGKEFKAIKDIKFNEKQTLGEIIENIVAENIALKQLVFNLQKQVNNNEKLLKVTIKELSKLWRKKY